MTNGRKGAGQCGGSAPWSLPRTNRGRYGRQSLLAADLCGPGPVHDAGLGVLLRRPGQGQVGRLDDDAELRLDRGRHPALRPRRRHRHRRQRHQRRQQALRQPVRGLRHERPRQDRGWRHRGRREPLRQPRFLVAFCIITVALVSGAVADRARFWPWMLFATLFTLFVVFPTFRWIWASTPPATSTAGWPTTSGVWDAARSTGPAAP